MGGGWVFQHDNDPKLEIDRYIGLPIFKHFNVFSVDTHTPGAVDTHTPGAVDTHTHTHTWSSGDTHTHTVYSGEAPARPPHVTLYKIHSFETH